MRRAAVLRPFTRLYDDARYLEVGVRNANTFNRVQEAGFKVAVDPVFAFDVEAARRDNPRHEYHEITSDEYFATAVEPDQQFDLIYLDGLHVHEQTLRDLMNALHHLQPQGVIVVIAAEHLCMAMRGIRKPGAKTVTSAVRGQLHDPATRAEAMSLIIGR